MRTMLTAAIVTAASLPALADTGPWPGLYRVEVTLEIPNVRGEMPFRTVERCIAAERAEGELFAIVSSPKIAECPVVHRAREGARIEVEVVCAPVNTGRASARIELAEMGYTGRIAVTMGGKNMTLTEIQRAERIGDCR